jgi:cyclophilin family peptidyl-prolyl cis-trans isomerase
LERRKKMKSVVALMVALIVAIGMTCLALAESGGEHSGANDPTTAQSEGEKPASTPATTPETPPAAVPEKPPQTVAPKVMAKPEANPVVALDTNYGTITVELFKDKAPISAENFLSYVREGFYDSTTFHRVVRGFVIQAGGLTPNMKEKPAKPPIKNEAANGLSNLRGTLSVARTSEINSGTTHFFINLVDNKRLDHTGNEPAKYGYAVFGKVIDGMDVVDKIAGVKVGPNDVPVEPVMIIKATIVKPQPKAALKPAETKAETKQAEPESRGEMKVEKKQINEPETGTQTQ